MSERIFSLHFLDSIKPKTLAQLSYKCGIDKVGNLNFSYILGFTTDETRLNFLLSICFIPCIVTCYISMVLGKCVLSGHLFMEVTLVFFYVYFVQSIIPYPCHFYQTNICEYSLSIDVYSYDWSMSLGHWFCLTVNFVPSMLLTS